MLPEYKQDIVPLRSIHPNSNQMQLVDFSLLAFP